MHNIAGKRPRTRTVTLSRGNEQRRLELYAGGSPSVTHKVRDSLLERLVLERHGFFEPLRSLLLVGGAGEPGRHVAEER